MWAQRILETSYEHHQFPSPQTRTTLAAVCDMSEQQVLTWFNNKRKRDVKPPAADDKLAPGAQGSQGM